MSRLPLLAAALLVTGCGNGPLGTICTDIGCSSGLEIRLSEPLPLGTTIVLESGGGVPLRVECDETWKCQESVFVHDFLPAQVRVTVELDGVTTVRDFSPAYEEERPNGENCPPTCTRGEVTLELES